MGKVDEYVGGIFVSSEFLNNVALAHTTGTVNHQGLFALFFLLPFQQGLIHLSFHVCTIPRFLHAAKLHHSKIFCKHFSHHSKNFCKYFSHHSNIFLPLYKKSLFFAQPIQIFPILADSFERG